MANDNSDRSSVFDFRSIIGEVVISFIVIVLGAILGTLILGRIDRVDARIDRMETRIDRLDERIDRLDARIDDLSLTIVDLAKDVGEIKGILINQGLLETSHSSQFP